MMQTVIQWKPTKHAKVSSDIHGLLLQRERQWIAFKHEEISHMVTKC